MTRGCVRMLERFEFAHEGARLAGTSPMRRAALRLTHVWLACIMLVAGCSAACGSADSQSHVTSSVELIIKTSTNPFFVDIEQGAQERANQLGLQLSVASGTADGDVDGQIAAINASIERNDRAIMITPSGPAVDGALKRARKAGIFVVALDTKPNDPAAADITFASDNFEAGRLIGAWAAEKKHGQPVVIAMLDLFVNRSVESDFNRDQGFLEGNGNPTGRPHQER